MYEIFVSATDQKVYEEFWSVSLMNAYLLILYILL